MNISHFDDSLKLWEQTVGIGPNDTKEEIKRYLVRNSGMSFVCIEKSKGKVIGAILGGHDGRHGYIYQLGVNNGHSGNSIGKTLVKHSADAIKNAGILRCNIALKTGNESGRDFWFKIGWSRLEELNMYSVVM